MVGEDQGVGDNHVFPSSGSEDDYFCNVFRSKRLAAAVNVSNALSHR